MDVKNLINSGTLYKKENSFDNFRSKVAVDPKATAKRITKITESDLTGADDYFKKIVMKAVRDVANPGNESTQFRLYSHTLSEISKVNDLDLPRYLFYRYRYDVFPNTHELDQYPPCLQVEIASLCNYRCVFCYQTDPHLSRKEYGHMGTMPLDLFKKVIDECEGKIEAITIASRGEPTICKDFNAMLEYMRGKFLASKVNTNASLLDEKKCHGILSGDIQTLVFSCDAAEEPLYSQLRVNGNLERVLANIRQFNEIRRKHYPQSKMVTRVSGVKVNDQQNMDKMESFWGELVDEVAFVKYNPWENTYERSINDETRPCSDLWRRAFVWWDGRTNPCDVDYLSHLAVGNIKDKSLSDLWRGESYENLRKLHLNKKRCDASPCNKCTTI